MNTVQLKYFIAVAETLSFTQAARELFVAQTAISQQIASLERVIGTVGTRIVRIFGIFPQKAFWRSWNGPRLRPSSMKSERQDF